MQNNCGPSTLYVTHLFSGNKHTLILPLSYLFPFAFHFSFTLCECRPVWDHPRSMLLHSQHQRIAFIFEHLAWGTRKRCCVTSQLCAHEDHPKLLKDPSWGKESAGNSPTHHLIKDFWPPTSTTTKKGVPPCLLGGRRGVSLICRGTGKNRHAGIHNKFQQQCARHCVLIER